MSFHSGNPHEMWVIIWHSFKNVFSATPKSMLDLRVYKCGYYDSQFQPCDCDNERDHRLHNLRQQRKHSENAATRWAWHPQLSAYAPTKRDLAIFERGLFHGALPREDLSTLPFDLKAEMAKVKRDVDVLFERDERSERDAITERDAALPTASAIQPAGKPDEQSTPEQSTPEQVTPERFTSEQFNPEQATFPPRDSDEVNSAWARLTQRDHPLDGSEDHGKIVADWQLLARYFWQAAVGDSATAILKAPEVAMRIAAVHPAAGRRVERGMQTEVAIGTTAIERTAIETVNETAIRDLRATVEDADETDAEEDVGPSRRQFYVVAITNFWFFENHNAHIHS